MSDLLDLMRRNPGWRLVDPRQVRSVTISADDPNALCRAIEIRRDIALHGAGTAAESDAPASR